MENKELEDRIREYYKSLNEGRFDDAHRMLDPKVTMDVESYKKCMLEFMERAVFIEVGEVRISRVLPEGYAKVYDGRGFARGETSLKIGNKKKSFSEVWVRDGEQWYNRCMGLVWNKELQ